MWVLMQRLGRSRSTDTYQLAEPVDQFVEAGRILDFTAILIIVGFAALHLAAAGRVSFTWDEATDVGTVSCLASTRDPFACLNEPQQSRLPFYLHALVATVRPGEYPHYLLSSAFGVGNLLCFYIFARRVFGQTAATLAASLYATSIPLIASGRMLLTHSNVIFTTFTIVTVICFFSFVQHERTSFLVLTGVAFGCSVASSLLGVFSLFVLVPFYAVTRTRESPARVRHLLFFPISVGTFFALTLIYVDPAIFLEAARGTLQGHRYPFWNIFGFGPESPWWFSLLLVAVKVGPWWILLLVVFGWFYFRNSSGIQKMLFASFVAGFIIYLLLKSAVFYDAPHHHVAFYPFLYLLIAVAVVCRLRSFRYRAQRAAALALLAMCFGLQVYDVWRFFPNYLFYGSQYGERFIGELYGPAVFHAQDKDPVNARIDVLLSRPGVEILVADHNALERTGESFVPFTRRDSQKRYEFAFVDRLYARHFTFPETADYNQFLARYYVEDYTYYFPPEVWAYKILRHRGRWNP